MLPAAHALEQRAGAVLYIARCLDALEAAHDLLDVANAHVRKKLQVATGIKGAADDRDFDRILSEVRKVEPKSDVEGAPEDVLVNGDKGKIPSEHISDEFSVLRASAEPKGVKRAEFANADNHTKVFNWVRNVHHLITR